MVKTYFAVCEQTKEKVFYYVDFDVIHLFLSFFLWIFSIYFQWSKGSTYAFQYEGSIGMKSNAVDMKRLVNWQGEIRHATKEIYKWLQYRI